MRKLKTQPGIIEAWMGLTLIVYPGVVAEKLLGEFVVDALVAGGPVARHGGRYLAVFKGSLYVSVEMLDMRAFGTE